jgi:protein-tyrosine phosphatase
VISSAGTRAVPDEPPHPLVTRLLNAHGDDASDWRSTLLTAELLDSADLVLAATISHRSQIAQLNPSVLRRTYPLLQFAALCRRTPGGLPGLREGVSWEDRLRTVRAVLPHEPHAPDLTDPIGRSFWSFRRTDRLVEDAAADVTGRRRAGFRSS